MGALEILTIDITKQDDSDEVDQLIDQILKIADECQLSRWTKSDYKAEMERKGSVIIGGRVESDLVGFIAARFNYPNTNGNLDLECAEADITNIAVLDDYRGKGIGTTLLNKLVCELKKLKIQNIWLEVRESNLTAQKFYLQNNFKPMQKRRNFYSQPTEDALIMKLDIITRMEN